MDCIAAAELSRWRADGTRRKQAERYCRIACDILKHLTGLRLRLHGRGFQSKRFHDLETESKTTRFRRVYMEPITATIKSNRLCQSDLVLRPCSLVLTHKIVHAFSVMGILM